MDAVILNWGCSYFLEDIWKWVRFGEEGRGVTTHIWHLVGGVDSATIKRKHTPLRSWLFPIPYNVWSMEGVDEDNLKTVWFEK